LRPTQTIFDGSTGGRSVREDSGSGEIFCAEWKSGTPAPPFAVCVTCSAPETVSMIPYFGPSDEEKRQYFIVSSEQLANSNWQLAFF